MAGLGLLVFVLQIAGWLLGLALKVLVVLVVAAGVLRFIELVAAEAAAAGRRLSGLAGGSLACGPPTARSVPDSPIRVTSETGPLRQVVVHTPGEEMALVAPARKDALLFDDLLFVEDARTEHATLCRLFETRRRAPATPSCRSGRCCARPSTPRTRATPSSRRSCG